MSRPVTAPEEATALQKDLDQLSSWSSQWLITFNVDKCKVMHMGRNNQHITYDMPGNGERVDLKVTSAEKDLGVVIDEDMSFQSHVETKTAKANQILGVIRRTFKYLDKHAFLCLYKSMVRPHLEYATSVWSPRLVGQKRTIEKVQRRATKLLPGLQDMSYRDRLLSLGLPTLEYRRLRADLIQTYKLISGLESVPYSKFFDLDTSGTTRGHPLKIRLQRTNTASYGSVYRHRIVQHWNKLPRDVVEAPTLNCFKSRLNKCYKNHPLKFTNSFDN